MVEVLVHGVQVSNRVGGGGGARRRGAVLERAAVYGAVAALLCRAVPHLPAGEARLARLQASSLLIL